MYLNTYANNSIQINFHNITHTKAKKRKQSFNIFHLINESIIKIPNDRIHILTVHFLELQRIRSIIKSAENHVNEREVARLYRDSFENDWMGRRKMSFNDQLDKFYVECLENRYESWNNNYFCTKRLTTTESAAFSESFQRKEETRFTRSFEKVERKFQRKVSRLEERYTQEFSTRARNKLETYRQRGRETVKKSQKLIKKNQKITAKYPEFLDYQMFHGSRLTLYWDFAKQDRHKIATQMKDLMNNNWPSMTLVEMHLYMLRISKQSKSEMRKNILFDINQQLKSKNENRRTLSRR